MPRVSLRDNWFLSQVIRVRLELTANGLKGHCYDVLTTDIIGLTESSMEAYPPFSYPLSQI